MFRTKLKSVFTKWLFRVLVYKYIVKYCLDIPELKKQTKVNSKKQLFAFFLNKFITKGNLPLID